MFSALEFFKEMHMATESRRLAFTSEREKKDEMLE